MSISWNQEFVRVLKDQFDRARERNGRYSMRAFAKHTGISIAGLSRTLRGDLTISSDRAAAMLDRLDLDNEERTRLLTLMGKPPQRNRRRLPEELFEILTNWRLAAVWMAFDLDRIHQEPGSIAERLGMETTEVVAHIERLIALGLLTVTSVGVSKEDLAWESGDGPNSEVIRQYHRRNLELAERALEEIPMQERDFASIMVTGSKQQIEQARAEIRQCLNRISNTLSSGRPRDEIYQVQVALFPIRSTKRDL